MLLKYTPRGIMLCLGGHGVYFADLLVVAAILVIWLVRTGGIAMLKDKSAHPWDGL